MDLRRYTTGESTATPDFSPRTQSALTSDIAIPPPPEAQTEFALAAALGHVNATHALVFEYLRKAADAGHTDSCYRVGRMFLFGEGTEQDPQAGVAYLARAASKQYTPANRQLGAYCADSHGDAKDTAKAVVYYNAVLVSGDQSVCYELGNVYHDMHQHDLAVQQYPLAIALFPLPQRAIKRNDTRAMYRLGMCYATGCGVAPDPKRAAELLLAAGEQHFMPDNYAVA